MIDKLFYVLLSYYSRNTNHKIDTPVITVYFIFTFLICSFLLLAAMILSYIQDIERKSTGISKPASYLMLVISGVTVYLLFVVNKRYLKVYNRFRGNKFLNSKAGKWMYWSIALIIVISPYVLILLVNKVVHGYWY